MSGTVPAAGVPQGRELVSQLVGTTTCMLPKPLTGSEPATVRAFAFNVATTTLDGIMSIESPSGVWSALGNVVNNHFFVQNAHEDWMFKYQHTWQDPSSWTILGFHDEAGAAIANCTLPNDDQVLKPTGDDVTPMAIADRRPNNFFY